QRRVLVRGGAGLRRGTGTHVHVDVHLRPGGRMACAYHGAEGPRPACPPGREVRRPRPAQAARGRGLGPHSARWVSFAWRGVVWTEERSAEGRRRTTATDAA